MPEEQRDAVRATLELNNYDKRDISPAELRARTATPKSRSAVRSNLSATTTRRSQSTSPAMQPTAGRRRFDVVPGEPAIVREARVEVLGEGKDQRRVARAVDGFVPKVGERLDHATYEASKAVIDTSLRGAGYLDAKYTQRRVTVRPEEQSADVDLHWESGPRYKFGDVRFAGDAPFPEEFLREFVPWREDAYFNSEQVLNLQQRLVDADYFELVSVQPALDEKKDGTVPIDVLLKRDRAHGVFGRGVLQHRLRRRRARGRGAPLAQQEGPQGRREGGVFAAPAGSGVALPDPAARAAKTAPTISASAYRDETTDVNRSRNFQVAATRSEKRWHGFTRTHRPQVSGRRFRDRPGRRQSRVRQLQTAVRRRHAEPAPRQRPARRRARATCSSSACGWPRRRSSRTPTSRKASAGSPG